MAKKEKTLKQLSEERAKILNSLKFMKDNSIIACNLTYQSIAINNEPITGCDLYSRKTKKRVTIYTNRLFDKQEFLDDKNGYIEKKYKKLTEK